MSFFPSTEPLSASPDPSRYERVLHRAAAGADGDDSCAWSIDDAAAFWLPGWTPPKSPDDGFAADMVMGLTTTALLWTAHEIPPLGQFFGALGRLSSFRPRGKEPFDGISPHAYCQAAHEAYAPASDAISERFHWVGFRALAEKRRRSCNLPECEDSESLLRHCLPRVMFDNAMRSGLLSPTRSLDFSPLALLITRLECHRHSVPYITVRDGNAHIKCLYCPYWVRDAIVTLACLIPALLVDADHQVLIRAHVAKSFEGQVELLNEPLPKPKGVVLRPLNFTIPTADVLVRKYTDIVWQSTGAAAGWASNRPRIIDNLMGRQPD